MKVIYIAGPIRSLKGCAWDREQNVRRAEALALEVWNAGGVGLCVHAMGRFYDDGDYDKWIAGDKEIISRVDALLMTPDWEMSRGAREEHAFAQANGIPVYYTLDAMRSFLK